MKKRRTAEEIKELLASYRARGEMTRKQFCESQGIPLATLDYYLRRYGGTSESLVKVDVQPAGEARFALVLDNGLRIECEAAGLPALVRIAEAW